MCDPGHQSHATPSPQTAPGRSSSLRRLHEGFHFSRARRRRKDLAVEMTSADAIAWGGEGLLFNAKDGFLEGVIRGCKGGLLTPQDYTNLMQCETLDDVKLHLVSQSNLHVFADTPRACFLLCDPRALFACIATTQSTYSREVHVD